MKYFTLFIILFTSNLKANESLKFLCLKYLESIRKIDDNSLMECYIPLDHYVKRFHVSSIGTRNEEKKYKYFLSLAKRDRDLLVKMTRFKSSNEKVFFAEYIALTYDSEGRWVMLSDADLNKRDIAEALLITFNYMSETGYRQAAIISSPAIKIDGSWKFSGVAQMPYFDNHQLLLSSLRSNSKLE